MERSTWVEISTAGLERNLRAVAGHAGVPVCAVVKANAYGHGLVPAARVLARAGAASLGVARIEEARALREAGIDAPVLVMMPVPDPAEAAKLDCAIAVGSADEIVALPAGARAHLKVDTGMGRLGVRPEEVVEAARAVAARCTLDAVWTHLADAAGRSGRIQLGRFAAVVAALRDAGIDARAHAANSAALLALPDARFDLVRVGTLLYGQDPPGARAPWQHAETFVWYARVAAVREVLESTPVGYGSEWRAPRRMRLATIPVGYADGVTMEPAARTPGPAHVAREAGRALRGARERVVWFGERRAPIVGRVAMQALTVSLEGLDDVGVGAVARIPARRLAVSPAIERVYTEGPP